MLTSTKTSLVCSIPPNTGVEKSVVINTEAMFSKAYPMVSYKVRLCV